MRKISIELVPHSYKEVQESIHYIDECLPSVNVINIPDISRLQIRSWEISAYFKRKREIIIPHIRALDFDCNQSFALTDFFNEHLLDTIIVVSGDKIVSPYKKKFYSQTNSISLMKKIKKAIPTIKIYGAIDPYRSSLRSEWEYIQKKIDAGFDGFFTQPIFDMKILELYSKMTSGLDVFWGISPILSPRSQKYWETVNNVIFPPEFKATMEYNVNFANQTMRMLPSDPFYFMPIKIELKEYFKDIVF